MSLDAKTAVLNGKTALGIEFGSTRIKAVLIDEENKVIAQGNHDWENRLENGIWTYRLEDIWTGLQDCYANMAKDVKEKYGVEIETIGSIGFSAMMHGYMAFNAQDELLVPFRTWRNTITEEAAQKLTELDDQFHDILYEACSSKMLEHQLRDFHEYVRRMRKQNLSGSERGLEAVLEHKQIMEAICRKDADRAQELAALHMRNAYDNMIKNGLLDAYDEKERIDG